MKSEEEVSGDEHVALTGRWPREGAKDKSNLSTGVLESLPRVPAASRLYLLAERASKKIHMDPKISNQRQAARKLAAQRLDCLGKAVSQPLMEVLNQYKRSLQNLHPFEAALADLTVRARKKRGHRTLLEQLAEVNELRKTALARCKESAGLANKAASKKEALEILDSTYSDLEILLNENDEVLLELNEIQQAVSKLPVVDLQLPTLVLVGAPNVGKSSIVRSISSGTPEVNNYPFTTRGMTMGHLYHPVSNIKCQVMDTPGLLSRPDEDRNEMEALTLASMQHLPTAVLFVMDLSGLSGEQSSIEKQIEVRNELRARFPRRPWVDVISKSDLPRLKEEEVQKLNWGHYSISVKTGDGVDKLCVRVIEMLEEVQDVLLSLGLAKQE